MEVIVGTGVLVGLSALARGEERLAACPLMFFGAVLTANELIGQPLDPRVR